MWNPPIALSPAEQKIVARTQKARKFFVFLRTIRHALLDAAFQQTLAQSYSPKPGGKHPSTRGSWRWPRCYKPTATSVIRRQWNSR